MISVVLAFVQLQPAHAAETSIESGHSGMWFDPARNGEGWVLEILEYDRALVYWFTYDDQGGQRWLLGVGQIERDEFGDAIHFEELFVTVGGRFGEQFDPGDVNSEHVGSAVMTFADCNHGEFSYSAFGHAQTIEIQRLSRTMAAGCAPIHGIPGEPVQDYAGQSGSWFDPRHSGEGFSLQWMPHDEALLTWYTYDSEGRQYWLVGTGMHQDGLIVFPTLHSTRGARFGEDFDPEDVELIEWGGVVLELNCSSGSISYESSIPEFGTGGQILTRLTRLEKLDCPWVSPKLTELYEFSWTEIPIEEDSPTTPNHIHAQSIANDGTVVALQRPEGRVHIWRPGTAEWEILPDEVNPGRSVLVSPDTSRVISTAERGPNLESPFAPIIWQEETGWQPINALIFDQSWHSGASNNRRQVVGEGRPFNDVGQYPWIWNSDDGQQAMPLTEAIPGATPTGASNDGRVVIGYSILPGDGFSPLRSLGVRWLDGGQPQILRDALGERLAIAHTCSADCSIVFGADQADFLPDHPDFREAWFWKDSGVSGYLGRLPDAVEDAGKSPYAPGDVTADGSMVVGTYITLKPGTNQLGGRGFIWTQNTGLVSIRDLLAELGLGDDFWETMAAVSITSSGDKILLAGEGLPPAPGRNQWRAVILGLSKK